MTTETAWLNGQNGDGLDFNENKYKAMCIERKNVICLGLRTLHGFGKGAGHLRARLKASLCAVVF